MKPAWAKLSEWNYFRPISLALMFAAINALWWIFIFSQPHARESLDVGPAYLLGLLPAFFISIPFAILGFWKNRQFNEHEMVVIGVWSWALVGFLIGGGASKLIKSTLQLVKRKG